MNIAILTGGDWPRSDIVHRALEGAQRVLCCDGAAVNAEALGIAFDQLVGDMDSIPQALYDRLRAQGMARVVLPAHKDVTDTHHACLLALEQGATRVTIIGGIGSRLDHSLGNVHCLWLLHEAGVEARMMGGGTQAFIVTGQRPLGTYLHQTFSLLPLTTDAVVAKMEGVAYPLVERHLEMKDTLGISNIVVSPTAFVSVGAGTVLLLVNDEQEDQ